MDDFDIHDPVFARDPSPRYRELRERDPAHPSARYGGFHLLTRYADVRAAALDWRRFTSSVVGITAIPVITPRTTPQLPIEIDPPQHSLYRALVNPMFSPQRIAEFAPTVEALARARLEAMLEAGRAEAVAAYCAPVALGTLSIFTGLPLEDAPLWQAWLEAMFDPRWPEAGRAAAAEFARYIDELIAKRSQAPQEDFVSRLLAAEIDGRKLDREDVRAFVSVMFGAGFETTADAMSGALHWLAEAPERIAGLSDAPAALAAEEFLRFISPLQMFGRNATSETTLHGQVIPEGRIVALGFGAANRDPEVFDAPEECRLDRAPNRHLTFGAGPHLCLGAPVARLEMQITLGLLKRRVARLSLDPDDPPVWKPRGDRRGLARLGLLIAGEGAASDG
jgi:cytochrome P450